MHHSTSVRKVYIASEPDREFFLKLEWAEDLGSGFVILLSDGVSAWSGEGKIIEGTVHPRICLLACLLCYSKYKTGLNIVLRTQKLYAFLNACVVWLVSEEDVSREARDIDMKRERYVQDLHLALTGEGQIGEGEYSFHLAPLRHGSPLMQLSYERVQNDISVSGTQEIATLHIMM